MWKETGTWNRWIQDEVEVGSVIVVPHGEKVPIDGTVIEGNSTLNTSALTGESLPREVKEGDEIISGCINMSGVLKIRTTKEFGESTVSKILDLVENSSSENPVRKLLFPNLPVIIHLSSVIAHWRWLCFRRLSGCCLWE